MSIVREFTEKLHLNEIDVAANGTENSNTATDRAGDLCADCSSWVKLHVVYECRKQSNCKKSAHLAAASCTKDRDEVHRDISLRQQNVICCFRVHSHHL
jgi:hypothetical protein